MWVGGSLHQPYITVIDPIILGVKINCYPNILQQIGDEADLEQI